MKITDVSVVHADPHDVGPRFEWRRGLPGSELINTTATLMITTSDGIVGQSTVARGRILEDLVDRRIRPELMGRDPLCREWLWHRMWELDRIEEFPIYVLGSVDVALWDIAGKAAGLPVWKLLGGFRESIPAYASTVTFRSVEEYLDVADQCLELGYPAIKLHAWGDTRRDAHLAEQLRAHVGDDVPLMYDGSAGFDLPDAIYVGHALADAGFLWYEEPMREFSVHAYRRLAERVRVPLLVAETSDGVHLNSADFIAASTATYVRTGHALKGGITGAMRIAHLAESFLLRAEVHGGGIVARNLCMAIPNTTYYESLVATNPVHREPSVDAAGMVAAPALPGLAAEPS